MLVLRPTMIGFFFGILKLNFFSFKTNSFLTTISSILISFFFNGFFKGLILGTKRILRCHPIKILGGRSGFDPAPDLKKRKK